MSATEIGYVGVLVLFGLLAVGMPVGIAMLMVGAIGFGFIQGWGPALATFGQMPFEYSRSVDLSVIPLFVLMGNLCTASGASAGLYRFANAAIGHWRGGLASATVAACAGFAAVSGSSLATAVTIGKVALPEMARYGYDVRLAAGTVAAGGTLGILIPPSTGFIIYALLTEQSVGRLFLAGFLPGLLLAGLFIVAIALVTAFRPHFGPAGIRQTWRQRLGALVGALPMLSIATISIGGIYVGVFTATEAATIGAFLSVLLTLVSCAIESVSIVAAIRLFMSILRTALRDTVSTTAMVFLILIGSQIFSPFLAVTQIPSNLAEALSSLQLPPFGVLIILIGVYVLLGMFLEGFSMLVLTLPIVFPIVTQLGYDPIWFGVLVVIILEMGLITPPVGLNVYVVKGIAGDIPMQSIFAGVLPFLIAMIVCIGLLIAFPQIALYLPSTMR